MLSRRKDKETTWSALSTLVCLVLLVALLVSGTASADQILLYDGKRVEGEILRESDTAVTIQVETIKIVLLRKDIREIRRGDNPAGSVAGATEALKPTQGSEVLPPLRETASAAEQTAQNPTATPKAPDTPANTVAPPSSPSPTSTQAAKTTAPAKATQTPTEPKPTNSPTFTQTTKPTKTPTAPKGAKASNTPTTAAEAPKATSTPTITPQPPVAAAPTPTSKPVEKPADTPKIDVSKMPKGDPYQVDYETLNIRKGPSSKEDSLGKLNRGDTIIVDKKATNGWVHFTSPTTGQSGWASGRMVKKLKKNPLLKDDAKQDTSQEPPVAKDAKTSPAKQTPRAEKTEKEPTSAYGSRIAESTVIPEFDATKMPKGEAYSVKKDSATVRKGPSPKDEDIGKVQKGEVLVVDDKAENGWFHFNAPGPEISGWIAASLLQKYPDSLLIVTAEKLNLRQGPGITNPRSGQILRGDLVRLMDEKDSWLKVRTLDNKIGWIGIEYVSKVPEGTP